MRYPNEKVRQFSAWLVKHAAKTLFKATGAPDARYASRISAIDGDWDQSEGDRSSLAQLLMYYPPIPRFTLFDFEDLGIALNSNLRVGEVYCSIDRLGLGTVSYGTIPAIIMSGSSLATKLVSDYRSMVAKKQTSPQKPEQPASKFEIVEGKVTRVIEEVTRKLKIVVFTDPIRYEEGHKWVTLEVTSKGELRVSMCHADPNVRISEMFGGFAEAPLGDVVFACTTPDGFVQDSLFPPNELHEVTFDLTWAGGDTFAPLISEIESATDQRLESNPPLCKLKPIRP
jgi:hypothetical protein